MKLKTGLLTIETIISIPPTSPAKGDFISILLLWARYCCFFYSLNCFEIALTDLLCKNFSTSF